MHCTTTMCAGWCLHFLSEMTLSPPLSQTILLKLHELESKPTQIKRCFLTMPFVSLCKSVCVCVAPCMSLVQMADGHQMFSLIILLQHQSELSLCPLTIRLKSLLLISYWLLLHYCNMEKTKLLYWLHALYSAWIILNVCLFAKALQQM